MVEDFGRFADPALLIMISLAGGDKHGYAMMEDIAAFAGVKIGPGTLYGALARLEARGWIEALASSDRRRPYGLTTDGQAALREQVAGWHTISSEGLRRLGAT
jgi:DNA-binding PadR family transcriptional regulator